MLEINGLARDIILATLNNPNFFSQTGTAALKEKQVIDLMKAVSKILEK